MSTLEVRNTDPGKNAAVIRQEPSSASTLPALAVSADDSTATAVLVKGAGTLLDLQNASATSKFKADNSGNLTVAGTIAATGAITATGGYTNASGLALAAGGVVPGSVLVAASTVANTGTETQLAGLSITASDPAAKAIYVIRASGVYSTTGTPTLAFGLRYGGAAGTSIATIAATTLTNNSSNLAFQLEAVLQFYDATHAVGFVSLDVGTSNTTNATTRLTGVSGAASVAVVSTSAKVMSVTVTWGAADPANTISAMTGYGARIA